MVRGGVAGFYSFDRYLGLLNSLLSAPILLVAWSMISKERMAITLIAGYFYSQMGTPSYTPLTDHAPRKRVAAS
eukprot:23031-Pleurochrysis_carterae.AAC.4